MDFPSDIGIDERRKKQSAYEYLCHLEEAKLWMEKVIKVELPQSSELESNLRNGVALALLGHFCSPETVPTKKIFDIDYNRYNAKGLVFKHTDNINLFFKAMNDVCFPKVFQPETIDIYEAKNMPRVIYCIHALSHYLSHTKKVPLIQNLYGKVQFTDEEIDKVQTNLEKYGIQMPVFSKIGGILAGELSEDQAARHAAIMLINEALDLKDDVLLSERLRSPSANIQHINDQNISHYSVELRSLKSIKGERSKAKQKVQDEVDVYDEILTHSEIQGNLYLINQQLALKKLNESIKAGRKEPISQGLMNEDLQLQNVISGNLSCYVDRLMEKYAEKLNDNKRPELSHEEINLVVGECNMLCTKRAEMGSYVDKVNALLSVKKLDELSVLFQSCPEGFGAVSKGKERFYVSFFSKMFKSDGSFSFESASLAFRIMSALCAINHCVDTKTGHDLAKLLSTPELGIKNVEESLESRYLERLVSAKTNRIKSLGVDESDLDLSEVKDSVAAVDNEVQEETDILEVIALINEIVKSASADELLKLLIDKKAKLANVIPENKHTYLEVMRYAKIMTETKTGDQQASIWHDEIQRLINMYNEECSNAHTLVASLVEFNKCLTTDDEFDSVSMLKAIGVVGVLEECGNEYVRHMREVLAKRQVDSWDGWFENTLTDQKTHKFYYNVKTKEVMWTRSPDNFSTGQGYLNLKSIQESCNRVGFDYNRAVYFKSNQSSIVVLQAWHKTCVMKGVFDEHLHFTKNKLPNLLLVQSYFRTLAVRPGYRRMIMFLASMPDKSLMLHSYFKTVLFFTQFQTKMGHYSSNVNNIVSIQSLLRRSAAQCDYNNFVSGDNPNLRAVCKYVNVMEFANDQMEEREMARLRGLVYDIIREVNDLEQDNKDMDLRIGLLVKNRINLQEVMGSRMSGKRSKNVDHRANITKEKLQLIEKYGNLFWSLQNQPQYMSRLILEIAPRKSNKYVKDICFALFNFGANFREEFLILKMFSFAVEMEINTRIENIQQFNKDDPVIVKLVIAFLRDLKAPTFLQNILMEPVTEALNNKNPISINPVEIYRQWLSHTESESGKASGLPYDVDAETALKREEVYERLKTNMNNLLALTAKFRDSITSSYDLIPFGIRYFAKRLFESLSKKFPDSCTKDLLKVIGNLLYYRFMNPAIVSPDAFKFFSVEKSEINSEQRKNLATVSSVLQNAATCKIYDGASDLFRPLNDFVEDAAVKFQNFFKECINVGTIENHFNIDEFSDQAAIAKPELKLPCSQLIEIHRLVAENHDVLCLNAEDPLNRLISSIGDVPKPHDLLDRHNKSDSTLTENEDESLGNTFIVLTLSPPLTVVEESEESKMKALLQDTIKMIIDILYVCPSESLKSVLEKNFTPEQEEIYYKLMAKRAECVEAGKTEAVKDKKPSAMTSVVEEIPSTLAQIKTKVVLNLDVLVSSGLVSGADDYSSVIVAIARHLKDKTNYRRRRRLDLLRLRGTVENMERKREYFLKQAESFNQYVKVCVDNLTRGKKSKGSNKHRIVVKKTAAKLHTAGVILEIEGLTESQFKNVVFEMSSTEDTGIFTVSAKLFGVQMDSIELVFQDLLQLQFENVSVMKMFERAKINVNLLIYFINKKFYSKKK